MTDAGALSKLAEQNMEASMTIRRIQIGRRMSQAVICGDKVYLSGLTAETTNGSAFEQTASILGQIDRLLEEAGTDKTRLLSANIWLSDIRYFDDMNAAWEAWLPEGFAPVRATVEAKLAGPEYLVEIMVQAAIEQ
jgi:enamine deaminase RidA (YjgF/YER057c/UK114 family)